DDVAEGRAHQASDAGSSREEHPLLPHLLQDGVAQPRVEPGAGERRSDRAGAGRTGLAQLAARQPMRVVEMKNAAFGVERRGDHAEAAEHAVTPKTRSEER